MNCHSCGAKIDSGSRFCPFCGAPQTPSRTAAHFESDRLYGADFGQKTEFGIGRRIAVLLCVVLLFGSIGVSGWVLLNGTGPSEEVKADGYTGKTPAMSPYEAVFAALPRSRVPDAVKAAAGVSSAIRIDEVHAEPDTLESDGILFRCGGEVIFSDSVWKNQEAPFETVFLLSDTRTAPVYCKIGEKVFLDLAAEVGSDHAKAVELLSGEDPWEAENWSRTAKSPGGRAALADYALIFAGMTPEETAGVVGCYGTETAHTRRENVEIVTFRWPGKGKDGAFIEVVYHNGYAVSKSRFGLTE